MKTPHQTLNPVLKILKDLYIITYEQRGREFESLIAHQK